MNKTYKFPKRENAGNSWMLRQSEMNNFVEKLSVKPRADTTKSMNF